MARRKSKKNGILNYLTTLLFSISLFLWLFLTWDKLKDYLVSNNFIYVVLSIIVFIGLIMGIINKDRILGYFSS